MELHKKLKFLDLFCIASGAMISSGIFILPGIAYAKGGPSIILGYFLGGVIAFIGIISIIELSTAMPKAGGDYFFVNKTFGPLMGTISGLLSWFALSLKTSLAIYGISQVLGHLIYENPTYFDFLLISFISIILFSILNIVGLDFASKFEVIIVIILLILIAIYIVFGISSANFSNFTPFIKKFNGTNFITSNNFIENIKIVISVSAFVFVSYGGLLQASSVSEEVIDPKKDIPRGIIVAVITTTIIYTLLLSVTIGNIPSDNFLIGASSPVANVAKLFLGEFGFIIIVIASMLAFVSTANAGIMAASRYPLALSRDNLFPKALSEVSPKFKTPIKSIIFTAIFIALSILFSLEALAKVASAVVLLAYILTNLTVIILRESGVRNYRPTFKSPFYPWTQIFSIFTFLYFLANLGFLTNFILILFILFGFTIYYKFGKENQQEYAFLHLLMKLTEDIELNNYLEEELREIIHERENIELDKFDYLVKEAPIIDVIGQKTIYDILNDNFSLFENIIPLNKDEFLSHFIKKEATSASVVNEFSAIPKIHLESSSFESKLIIIRGKDGIKFKDNFRNMNAIFLFILPKGYSKPQLKFLSAIVHLVNEIDFEDRWMEANNTDHLKDIILLSERKRYHKS